MKIDNCWCRLFVDSLIQLTSSWLYSYEVDWQCFITRSCLNLRSLSRLWEQSSYDIKYNWYQSVSRMYSNCKWWFQMRYWKLMYEFSNLNHHENKIKVLLKYILFFFGHEKNEWMCSDVSQTATLKLLGTSACWLRTEPAGSGSNEMFSWWVGDLYVWANLVDGMNLE